MPFYTCLSSTLQLYGYTFKQATEKEGTEHCVSLDFKLGNIDFLALAGGSHDHYFTWPYTGQPIENNQYI